MSGRDAIAIVGMACRFPGANSIEAYWANLIEGRDLITEIPPDRWDMSRYFQPPPSRPGKSVTRWGGFLDDITQFDHRFFKTTEREAPFIDPQQRLLLETSWNALMDAGIPGDSLAGSHAGVFVGISTYDYGRRISSDLLNYNPFVGTGSSLGVAANRISYFLDLHGPSFAIDTACSSALVAMHVAAKSIQRGECPLAMVGGVNAIIDPGMMIGFSQAAMMAPDGRCKTFDSRADGFVRSEGCGVVILKPLMQALKDGNRIWATIQGSATNQDGSTNGLSAPNGAAQAMVIASALRDAGHEAAAIDHVEAHGTGTSVGDVIEIGAINRALLRDDQPRAVPLSVSSVKTNIGHTEAASGIASVIKVALSLKHAILPRHLHLQTLNPHLPIERDRIRIPVANLPWPVGGRPRLAGVSAFGFGGTNAHVILSEPPSLATAPRAPRSHHVVSLSARSEKALEEMAQAVRDLPADAPLEDLAYSLSTSRSAFPFRWSAAVGDRAELNALLQSVHARPARSRPRLAFLFTGQGGQYPGMGATLYQCSAVFRAALDEVTTVFAKRLDAPLLPLMLGTSERPELIHQTLYTQLSVFSLQYALTQFWRAAGIQPDAVLGHSIGEYAAAWSAGRLGFEQACELVLIRARLMQSLPEGGGMAVVQCSEAAMQQWLHTRSSRLDIAAVNASRSVVLAGDLDALKLAMEELSASGIHARIIPTSHAFHSRRMDPILGQFESEIAPWTGATEAPGQIELVSSLTGQPADATFGTSQYWRNHLRQPVRFLTGSTHLTESGCEVFVEIGPGSSLLSLLGDTSSATLLPSLHREHDDWRRIGQTAAALDARGLNVHWAAWHAEQRLTRTSIPGYPFQKQRFWGISRDPEADAGRAAEHPTLGERSEVPGDEGHTSVFRKRISLASPSWLPDHRVAGTMVFPGAAYVDGMLSILAQAQPQARCLTVSDIAFEQALTLDEAEANELQWTAKSERVTVWSKTRDGWKKHAAGTLKPESRFDFGSVAVNDLRQRFAVHSLEPATFYRDLEALGLNYGPAFQCIRRLASHNDMVLAEIEWPGAADEVAGYQLHPALLDAAFQSLAVLLNRPSESEANRDVLLPVGLQELRFHRPAQGITKILCLAEQTAPHEARLTLAGEDGQIFCEAEGLRAQAVSRDRIAKMFAPARPLSWLLQPKWIPLRVTPVSTGNARDAFLILGSPADPLAQRLKEAVERLGHPASIQNGLARTDMRPGGVIETRTVRPASASTHFATALETLQSDTVAAIPIFYLTRGARVIHPSEAVARERLTGAAVWGLCNSARLESRRASRICVDLDPAQPNDDEDVERIAQLCSSSLQSTALEDRVALRGAKVFAERLVRADRPGRWLVAPKERSYRLGFEERGSIEAFALLPVSQREPGDHEIEIRVRAAGINFRDLMNVLGSYPGDPGEAGIECAGVVERVGPKVTRFKAGDRVAAMVPGAFRLHCLAPENLAVRIPADLSFEAAASVPVVFLTAQLALESGAAPLQKGQSVLVHAAAGGVGLACVQIALRAGARVFATAGSTEKRELLESLGVERVYSSRSLAFVDALRADTAGKGVDRVINSLAGAFIPASFSVLKPGGTFVEIGKTGVLSAAEAQDTWPGIHYHLLALDELAATASVQMARTLDRLVDRFATRELEPITRQVFPLERARAAFRLMSTGRHIGKLVLRFPDATPTSTTYLVTGGTGGIGAKLVDWLAGRGAARVLVVSRTAPAPAVASEFERLSGLGTQVLHVASDLQDEASFEAALRQQLGSDLNVHGIFHAAGVTRDRPLHLLTAQDFDHVFAAKGHALEVLERMEHRLGWKLETFVAFSSLASVTGNVAQGNYAAANAYLNEWSLLRRNCGKPALAIAWGPWSGAGMASRLAPEYLRLLAESGVELIEPRAGIERLEHLLATELPVGVVVDADWHRLARTAPAGFLSSLADAKYKSAPQEPARPMAETLRALAEHERPGAILTEVARVVASVAGSDADTVRDAALRFEDLGLDSLMSVEIRSRLMKSFAPLVEIPHAFMFEYPTLGDFANFVVSAGSASQQLRPAAAVRELRKGPTAVDLYCIPHAGAGASIYARWASILPEWIRVVPLQIPGREELRLEPPPADLLSLAAAFAEQIRAQSDGAVALFGHSMGSVIAFETCRALEQEGPVAPGLLFVSAMKPELLQYDFSKPPTELSSREVLATLEKSGIPSLDRSAIEKLSDVELDQLTHPLKADLLACGQYQLTARPQLRCPIVVFGGTQDTSITRADLKRWTPLAESVAPPRLFEGGHFYWKEHQASLSALLASIAVELGTITGSEQPTSETSLHTTEHMHVAHSR